MLLLIMRRWFSWSAVLVILASAADPARAGDYLPAVGPPPLRFEAPRSPAARYPLPPLETPSTNAVSGTAGKTNPPPPKAASAEPVPHALPPLPLAEPPVVTTVAPTAWPTNIVPLTTPDAPLSPQMFMHYFTRGVGTNGAAGSVIIPLNFLPPLPLTAPSSSAVYEVTPAPKP
jgi:hypothetical protein